MKNVFFLFVFLTCLTTVSCQTNNFFHKEDDYQSAGTFLHPEFKKYFDKYQVDGSIAIYDNDKKTWILSDTEGVNMNTLPASTFKIINMLIFIVSLVSLRKTGFEYKGDLTIKDLVKKIFVNKDLMNIYYVSFLLEFFYALMTIYMPLYLLDLGLGWDKIGIIFTIMLVPFVLVEYPAGIIADSKHGQEKKMILISICIIAFSTLSIFFIKGTEVWMWAMVLFTTRIGAALLEVLRDSYFYKKIDGRDVDIISFFRTARPVSYVVAAVISAIFVAISGISSVFVVISIVALLALFPALRLSHNGCGKQGN